MINGRSSRKDDATAGSMQEAQDAGPATTAGCGRRGKAGQRDRGASTRTLTPPRAPQWVVVVVVKMNRAVEEERHDD